MLLQIISVVGALMVLSAYGLLQGGVWRELHAGYLALNIVGSLLLGDRGDCGSAGRIHFLGICMGRPGIDRCRQSCEGPTYSKLTRC